jgi:hypothetical protein
MYQTYIYICIYVYIGGELGSFLEATMDGEEQEEVYFILRNLVDKEINEVCLFIFIYIYVFLYVFV